MRTSARLIKEHIKTLGFRNVKYVSFRGDVIETLKFYLCTPNDEQIQSINQFMTSQFIKGYAKRIITERHAKGFIEILIYK